MHPMSPLATQADIQRLSAAPYQRFMPHRRVLAALEAVAAQHGARPALTGLDDADPATPARRWTHAQLVQAVRRAANLFHALSPGRPPRVALLLPPMPEAHLALWGAETAGTACPINFQLQPAHIAELLNAFGADILVALGPAPDLDIDDKVQALRQACPGLAHVLHLAAGPGLALRPGQRDLMAEAAAQPADALRFTEPAEAPAALFHTGGTTGAPKLAQHTHANQLHAAWGAACLYGARPQDVILNGFPLFHVAGAFVYGLALLLAGAELVLPTRTGLRNPAVMAGLAGLLARHRVTLLASVPTVIAGVLALNLAPDALPGVRALLTGGSPLPDELAAAFEARHRIPVRNILGMTECAGVISIEPLAAPRTPGSCGLPLPFSEVQALGPDGRPLPPGASGILRVRGPQVSPGYTDAARNPGTFEDGWLLSGDIGHVDAQGRVFVTGRAKDVIIRGAHNIDPGQIESVLLRHPAVQMAAAVGEPDAYAGELPVAFVALKPGAQATADALLAFAAPLIAERPAVPRRITLLPALPTTAVGKVYKPRLRALAVQQAIGAQLQQHGLSPRVALALDETDSGLRLRFQLSPQADGSAAAADLAALRALMAPYALAWTVEGPAPA